MNPQVGDNIKFFCNYERCTKAGKVLRILEEIEGRPKPLFLVESHAVADEKQWMNSNRIFRIITEGEMENVELNNKIKELGGEVESLKAVIELAGKINKEFRGLG